SGVSGGGEGPPGKRGTGRRAGAHGRGGGRGGVPVLQYDVRRRVIGPRSEGSEAVGYRADCGRGDARTGQTIAAAEERMVESKGPSKAWARSSTGRATDS